MKHSLHITLIIIALFIMTQLVGLLTVNKHIKVEVTEAGETVILHPDTMLGEPLKVEEQQKSFSFIYISIGVLIGTLLVLLFIKFNVQSIWKYWFLLAVISTLAVSFGVYVSYLIAGIAAVILGWWKVFKPNVWVHNFTEIFVYTGITIIFLPILNLTSVIILLLIISLYDMFAVWKSKHMIKMALFQTKAKVFAGLLIPYTRSGGMAAAAGKEGKKKLGKVIVRQETKSAVLGGGDIAFPLLFSSTVMEHLIKNVGVVKETALGFSAIITATTTLALFLLLYFAKEDRFYPAMPFVTAGCLAGLGIVWMVV